MKKKLFLSISIFIAVYLFINIFTLMNVDSIHDGILFKPALDVSRGKILFRDTFTQYGALTTFVQAAFLKLFGSYLLVMRQSAVLFYALSAVLLWNIWSRFLNKKFTLLSLLFWLSLAPFYSGPFHSWSSVYALSFQCLTILSLIIFCEKKRFAYLVIAGASAALASWARQPVGIYLLMGLSLFFILLNFLKKLTIKQSFLAMLVVSFGFLLASLPFLIYLVRNNALSDWWLQSFVFQREWAAVVRGINIGQILKSLLITRYFYQIYLYVFWLLLPLSLVYLGTRAFLKKQIALLGAMILSVSSWLQYYPVNDPPHFFWADAVMIGFFIYLVVQVFPQKRTVEILTIVVVGFFILRITPGLQKMSNATRYSQGVDYLRSIKLTPNEAEIVDSWSNQLSHYLKNGKTYINTSGDPLISLLSPNLHSIGPMYAMWEFVRIYPNYDQQVRAYVEKNHPLIVTRYGPFFNDYCRLKIIPYFDPKIYVYAYCKDLL